MSKYLTLNQYDGSLGGTHAHTGPHEIPPAGYYDVASPGGLASIQHHWTHGLFGKPEQVYDAYAGTGDRYIAGEYGNLYKPRSHASVYDLYRGPSSNATEYQTFSGEPYYWQLPTGEPPSNRWRQGQPPMLREEYNEYEGQKGYGHAGSHKGYSDYNGYNNYNNSSQQPSLQRPAPHPHRALPHEKKSPK